MIFRIGSPTNKKLKALLKEREIYYIFEGKKLVKDILKKSIKISKLIVNEKMEGTFSFSNNKVEEIWYVKEPVLKKISSLKEKNDFIAVLKLKEKKINFKRARGIIVLDNVQDPTNAGTVFRCAVAFGFDSVAFTGLGVKPNNSKFLRTAQNSLFNVNFESFKEIKQLIKKSIKNNFYVYLTSSKYTKNIINIDQTRFPCLIIFGNEGKGLNKELFNKYPAIQIPQSNNVESLNVGISACIIMHELRKL